MDFRIKKVVKKAKGLLALTLLTPGLASAAVMVYGQVNRQAQHVSDGSESHMFFADNDNSPTWLGAKYWQDVDQGLSVGAKLEVAYEQASSNDVSQLDRWSKADSTAITIRHADTWIKSDFGKLSLGQGMTASDSSAEQSLGGVRSVSNSTPFADGGFYFHKKDDKDPVGDASEPRVKSYFSGYDGMARHPRIRYDSPTYMGFRLAAAFSNVAASQYGSDIGLFYSGDLMGFAKLKAAIGHYRKQLNFQPRRERGWLGSFGILHPETGLNAHVSFGTRSKTTQAGHGGKSFFVQIGKKNNLVAWGKTNVMIDYHATRHQVQDDDDGKSYGIGLVQMLDKVNSELYLAAHNYKLDRKDSVTKAAIRYDNLVSVKFGIKIKFGAKVSA